EHPEAVGVCGDLGRRIAPVDVGPVDGVLGRTFQREPGPVLLGGRDVLDQATEGELADRGPGAGLVVGDALDGDPEQAAVLLEHVEDVGALAGEAGSGSRLGIWRGGHGATLAPSTDTGPRFSGRTSPLVPTQPTPGSRRRTTRAGVPATTA